MTPNILLIEDDESFGYILAEYLQLHEFKVDWARDGKQGLDKLRRGQYAMGIFDVMLPDTNGYEIAETIKQEHPNLPFIFLSARSLKIDKLKGYKVGADDYITKPVDEELLLAKIKALLKRSERTVERTDQYQIGAYTFTVSLQVLQHPQQDQKLTQRETELLEMLCQHQDRLLPRKQALTQIWGSTDEFSRKSMDVFISHLRKYLSHDPRISIKNIHGKGFVLSWD